MDKINDELQNIKIYQIALDTLKEYKDQFVGVIMIFLDSNDNIIIDSRGVGSRYEAFGMLHSALDFMSQMEYKQID